MDLAICQHIKLGGGGRCGSPAMRGQDYCYFHAGAHRAIPSLNLWPNRKDAHYSGSERIPSIRSAQAQLTGSNAAHQDVPWQRCKLTGEALELQVALSRFLQGIWQGRLNLRQAKIIMAALQRAMADLRDRTATERSAATSNQLRLPNPGGYRAFKGEWPGVPTIPAFGMSTLGRRSASATRAVTSNRQRLQ